ncbi:MAG: hypothetical protein ACI9QD_001235 [Thermoproteota archaeon]|jgi:hypothetical protein
MIKADEDFEKAYWDSNYAEPETMDGIGNVKDHVNYMKAVFEMDSIDISSVIDFGFGLGYLFQKVLKAYIPYRACGIEPSKYAFDKATKRKLKPVDSTKLYLYQESMKEWCERKDSPRLRYDLGLCTSVLQYIPDEDLDFILATVSMRVKYLYLTVPTDIELDRQIEELEFHDVYAIRRSREAYHNILGKHFTFVSSRVMESKSYFDDKTTFLTDLLFRY